MMIDMNQPLSENSVLESQIRPLINIANTELWKAGLHIFYLNGSVLNFSEEFDMPCLIGASIPYNEIETSIDLMTGKAKTEMMLFIKPLLKIFYPSIIGMLGDIKIETDDQGNMTESTTLAFIAKFYTNYSEMTDKLSKILLDGIFTLSEIFIIGIFENLNKIREGQIHSGILEDDYEEMVEALERIEFIKPKLKVSLCPSCLNYEFSISNYSLVEETCPKCGSLWATQVLYVFDKAYNHIKSQNMDLPLFISSFLRQQIGAQAPFSDFEIYPNARLTISEDEKQVEIDVLIPQFLSGIECKIFEDALAPMTASRVNGISGRLSKQIDSYIEAGMKRISVITNLTKDSAIKVQQNLQRKYDNQSNEKPYIAVFGGDVEDLLNFLLTISKNISEELNKDFENLLQKSLPKLSETDENSSQCT